MQMRELFQAHETSNSRLSALANEDQTKRTCPCMIGSGMWLSSEQPHRVTYLLENPDSFLLEAPGLTTRSKKLLGAPGIATRSKKLRGAPGIAARSKKLLGVALLLGARTLLQQQQLLLPPPPRLLLLLLLLLCRKLDFRTSPSPSPVHSVCVSVSVCVCVRPNVRGVCRLPLMNTFFRFLSMLD